MGLDRIDNQVKIAEKDSWIETASADNAVASATVASVTGKSHYISSVSASYSGAVTGLLQVKDGLTVIAEHYINDADSISFPVPIKATEGNAISVEIPASGTAGVLGKVNVSGFTV